MFIQILIVILIGMIFGVIVGLLPGLHPNTVAVLMLSLAPFLLQYTTPLLLSIFIVVVSVSNTFLDAIPSIYLGAPEDDTALNVLPGHRMLLQGKGHEAFFLTLIGSFCGLILAVAIIPLLIPMLNFIYPFLKVSIGYLLILVMFILIIKEKSRFWALIVFLLSGVLGLATLNLPNLREPLFPLFSGLFGVSGLLLSLKTKPKIPKQIITIPQLKNISAYKAIFVSLFSGSLVSLLPGVGSAQAAIIGNSMIKESDSKNFLIMVGGINTVNFIISFVSLYVLDKARNGSIVAISKILKSFNLNYLILFVACALIAGAFSVFVGIKISKFYANYILKINYSMLCIILVIFIVLMTVYLSRGIGLLILTVSTFTGLIPPLKNIGRNHLMGCLILPVILYFF